MASPRRSFRPCDSCTRPYAGKGLQLPRSTRPKRQSPLRRLNAEPLRVVLLPDGHMDAPNAARYLEIFAGHLANLRSEGASPAFIKCGRIWYYQDDLHAWLQEAPRCISTAQCRFLTAAE
jgi:hypothetical protein